MRAQPRFRPALDSGLIKIFTGHIFDSQRMKSFLMHRTDTLIWLCICSGLHVSEFSRRTCQKVGLLTLRLKSHQKQYYLHRRIPKPLSYIKSKFSHTFFMCLYQVDALAFTFFNNARRKKKHCIRLHRSQNIP